MKCIFKRVFVKKVFKKIFLNIQKVHFLDLARCISPEITTKKVCVQYNICDDALKTKRFFSEKTSNHKYDEYNYTYIIFLICDDALKTKQFFSDKSPQPTKENFSLSPSLNILVKGGQVSRFPCCVFHISNFDICHETDKYKYKIMKASVTVYYQFMNTAFNVIHISPIFFSLAIYAYF